MYAVEVDHEKTTYIHFFPHFAHNTKQQYRSTSTSLAELTGRDSQLPPRLPPLVRTTFDNFPRRSIFLSPYANHPDHPWIML